MTLLLDLRQDGHGQFHYEAHPSGQPRTHVALCGAPTSTMATRAWFRVGDPRGDVHYVRACDACRDLLAT